MGQGYSQAGTFWCVLNVSLRAYGAQLELDIVVFKCGYKNSLVITKIPPGTVQNHENPPVNTKNQPTFYFLLSTLYFLLSTFYFLLSK